MVNQVLSYLPFSTRLRVEKPLSGFYLCCFYILLSMKPVGVATDRFVELKKASFDENVVLYSYKILS